MTRLQPEDLPVFMSDQFIPFHLPSIGAEERAAVDRVLRTGWLTTGPCAQAFEREFAHFIGVKHALAAMGVAEPAVEVAERWRPWRAYAVQHLWASLGEKEGKR